MGLAVVGAAMILISSALRGTTVRTLARKGRPVNSSWRYVRASPQLWAGVGLIAIAVNKTAGEVAVAVWLVWSVWFVARLAVHGLRGLRRSPTAIRRIGDPRAWRGELPENGAP